MAAKKGKTAGEGDKGETSVAVPGMGKIKEFTEFLELSKVEIKKVTWPTRKETTVTSVAVLVLVLVMSVFLGVVDLGLSKLIQLILS